MPHKNPIAKQAYMKKRYRRKRDEIKAYQKQYNTEHGDEIRERRRDYQRERYLERCVIKKLAYILRAGGRCKLCGMEDIAILQFHHRDPSTKSFIVGNALRENREKLSRTELETEIAKCDLLCPNCHAAHHNSLTPTELENCMTAALQYFREAA